jgi:hypothetical protein
MPGDQALSVPAAAGQQAKHEVLSDDARTADAIEVKETTPLYVCLYSKM